MFRCVRGGLAISVCIVCGVSNLVRAQDWTDGSLILWNSFGSQGSGDGQFEQADGIAVDEDGVIYVSDYQLHRIQVFKADGTFVRKWGSQGSGINQFQHPRGLDIGPDGNLYVCDWGNNRICVYQPDGTFVRSWGSYGSGEGQFNHPYRISVSPAGQVFVVDFSNRRVEVFDSSGVYIRQFNTISATSVAQVAYAILATDEGDVFVSQAQTSPSYDNGSIVKYDAQGTRGITFPIQVSNGNLVRANSIRLLSNGGIITGGCYNGYNTSSGYDYYCYTCIYNSSGQVKKLYQGSSFYRAFDADVAPDNSSVTINDYHTINVLRWSRRGASLPEQQLGCWAKIEHVHQRGGYPYLDIDFRANSDNGTTNAHVAMCAFLNGGVNLANLIPMRNFVDGTETNLGTNIELSADVKRVTWNMAADWSSETGNLQIQAFAQQGPYYLPFNFLTIPAGGGVSNSFQICRSPVTDADLKSVWIFLVASLDPEVELVDGIVYGKGGPYEGQQFYSNIVIGSSSYTGGTSEAGWQFLLGRMNLREPTSEELNWAETGTIPGIQKWIPRYKVGGVPAAVNEFGLDTGDYILGSPSPFYHIYYKKFWAVKE